MPRQAAPNHNPHFVPLTERRRAALQKVKDALPPAPDHESVAMARVLRLFCSRPLKATLDPGFFPAGFARDTNPRPAERFDLALGFVLRSVRARVRLGIDQVAQWTGITPVRLVHLEQGLQAWAVHELVTVTGCLLEPWLRGTPRMPDNEVLRAYDNGWLPSEPLGVVDVLLHAQRLIDAGAFPGPADVIAPSAYLREQQEKEADADQLAATLQMMLTPSADVVQFSDWLDLNHISIVQLAVRLDCSVESVRRWKTGYLPQDCWMERLDELSSGRICRESFPLRLPTNRDIARARALFRAAEKGLIGMDSVERVVEPLRRAAASGAMTPKRVRQWREVFGDAMDIPTKEAPRG